MKMALYARVSTRDKGQNPDMQIQPMLKYAAESAPGSTTEFYIDKAESADLIGRKAWSKLMKDASLHKFDLLLIWKLDRAFRSIQHARACIDALNSYGVGFRSLMDAAIDTTTPNGILVFNILASVAEFEKSLIVMRVNEGMKYAKAHGTKSGRPIGRPALSLPIQTICKAVYTADGNYSEAARLLSFEQKIKVKSANVSIRLKRAGIDKTALLQTPAHYFDAAQLQSKVLKP